MPGSDYTGLTVSVRRDEESGVYKIGVVLDGAFVPFAQLVTGHVDAAIDRARESAGAAAAPQPASY